jgi:hypothetical protein
MLDRANLASNVSGVLVIDKPTGMTSHDVVQVVRNGTIFAGWAYGYARPAGLRVCWWSWLGQRCA